MIRYELQTDTNINTWVTSHYDDFCESLSEKKQFAKDNFNVRYRVKYRVVKIVTTATVIYPKPKRRKK